MSGISRRVSDTSITAHNTSTSSHTAIIGDRAYTEDNYVTDAETVTASVDALDMALNDTDTAIGTRTYTEQNYVTNGETITDSIDALDMAVADKADIVQESWNVPTLKNSWVATAQPTLPVGYMKDEFGIVRLRGLIQGGVSNTVAFTLPVGYRPTYIKILIGSWYGDSSSWGAARFTINTNGDVTALATYSGYISMDGLTFELS